VRVCGSCYNSRVERRTGERVVDEVVEEVVVSPVAIVARDKENPHQGTLMSIPTDWNWSTF
jgi:hypothetical protein